MKPARLDVKPVPALIRDHMSNRGSQVAMRHKRYGVWREYTWREVGLYVEQLAAWIIESGDDSECVGIVGNNEPQLFWAEYAINSAGKAVVCLYPDLESSELAHILAETRPATIFVEDQEQADKILSIADSAGISRICYWDERGLNAYEDSRLISFESCLSEGARVLRSNAELVTERIDSLHLDDLAVIIYTSGTTSLPKGTRGSHRYLIDCALRWGHVLGVQEGRDYVSYISPAWATEQYLGITLGVLAPLIVNFAEAPDTVTRDIREVGSDYLFFSPRQWEQVVTSIELRMQDASPLARRLVHWALKSRRNSSRGRLDVRSQLAWFLVCRPLRDRLGLARVRAAVNSGGALGQEVFEQLSALGVQMHNVYGFTEVGIVAATDTSDRYETVGRPLRTFCGPTPIELRIHEHEIQVRGGVPFLGYQASASSDTRFAADGWIRSGDCGYVTDDGYLVYLDRLDSVTILEDGQVAAPQFVETRLRLSPYIQEVVVLNSSTGNLHALVQVDEETIRNWAEDEGFALGSYQALSQHPAVRKLVEQEIERVNRLAPPRSRVLMFANLLKKLDADDGELTRSRKVKKAVVVDRYADIIDAMERRAPRVDAKCEVRYADGRSTVVHGTVEVMQIDLVATGEPEVAAESVSS